MIWLRQSTASQEVPLGHFVDDTDGKTAETALSIANTDIKIHKAGATTLANKNSGGATHISGGVYYAVLDATDTDTIGPLRIFVHVSGALPVKVDCGVLDEAVYDVIFGTTALSTYAGGAVASVTGNVGGNVTGSVGSLAAQAKADVNAEVDTALADYDGPTNAEMVARTLAASDYATASALDAVDNFVDTEVAAIKAVTDKLDTAVELDGAVYRFTTNALEQAPGGGSAQTAAEIADAVWDEPAGDHTTSGTTGAALGAAGSAGDPWETSLPGAYGSGTAGKIIGDNLNATVGSRATQTSVDDLPTNAELATALASADDAVLAAVAALNDPTASDVADAVRTELATELAHLDADVSSRLASAGYTAPDNAGIASAAQQSTLLTVAGYVDTEVAAIKAKTDNLPASPAATGDIPTATENADALLDRANAIETGLTTRQALRLVTAAEAGKLSGAGTTTVTIRNAVADSKARITATVDEDGNRAAVTTDLT